MSGIFDGKVVLITGAARGQGRSHAVGFAQEGADVVAIDLCGQIDSVPYPMGTAQDLAETAAAIEALGSKVVPIQADVRSETEMGRALAQAAEAFGRLDVVIANAGIISLGTLSDLDEAAWRDVIDVNLTGAWRTVRMAVPQLRATGGGSVILTGSTASTSVSQNIGHYAVSKHGLIGLMRTFALELAPDSIRVNAVLPTSVDTDLIQNDAMRAVFAPDLPVEQRSKERLAERFQAEHALDVPWLDCDDVTNGVVWLASEQARYITGTALSIDAGRSLRANAR